MVDVGSTASSIVAGAKSVGMQLVSVVVWLAIILVVAAIVGLFTWLYIKRKKFKYTITIFEKINGRMEPTKRDRAVEIRHGGDGTTVFYLEKNKKTIPRPTIQTGRNSYWFWIREDGEWINFGPGDFDEEARKLGAHFLDKEMRYARTSIQKGLKDRFEKKPSWLAEHWTMIAGISFIAIIGILTFLLFKQWIELAGATNEGVAMAGEVLDKVQVVLGSLDNICSGGRGYVASLVALIPWRRK
jgi:hypothetical protein